MILHAAYPACVRCGSSDVANLKDAGGGAFFCRSLDWAGCDARTQAGSRMRRP